MADPLVKMAAAADPTAPVAGAGGAIAGPDRLTLIAVSALAYVVAVALHEHLGHAVACVALGSDVKEFGAFYVNCDDARLSDAGTRLVALAGPVISLLIGVLGFALLQGLRDRHSAGFYFVWLLGTLGLMDSTGYVLFSGFSGLGDLGTTRDGALHGVSPEWLWRLGLGGIGALLYYRAVVYAVRRLDPQLAGSGSARITGARRMALVSYLTGAAVYLAIGVLNPYGFVIVATSALASSMGGTSGLLWMMQRLDVTRTVPEPGLSFARDWRWIAVSAAATIAYGSVLGPTLRP